MTQSVTECRTTASPAGYDVIITAKGDRLNTDVAIEAVADALEANLRDEFLADTPKLWKNAEVVPCSRSVYPDDARVLIVLSDLFGKDASLTTRRQARRVVERAELYLNVEIDFADIRSVRAPFADEVFGRWVGMTEGLRVRVKNAKPAVMKSIAAVQAKALGPNPAAKAFR